MDKCTSILLQVEKPETKIATHSEEEGKWQGED